MMLFTMKSILTTFSSVLVLLALFVVITKCYHLFCSSCIQKVAGSRHRKCPQCATSFGVNDVKPVYL